MAAWKDVEFLLVQWFREGDRDALADLESLRQEQEDLAVTQQHMVHKFDKDENAILTEMQWRPRRPRQGQSEIKHLPVFNPIRSVFIPARVFQTLAQSPRKRPARHFCRSQIIPASDPQASP